VNTMKYLVAASILSLAALAPAVRAQTTYSENFTGTSTNNSWFFLNGACLTAGTSTSTTATNPACQGLPYYTAKGDTLFAATPAHCPTPPPTAAERCASPIAAMKTAPFSPISIFL